MKQVKIFFVLCTSIFLTGCVAADSQLNSANEREMTVGIVQKEIRVGMSQAEVAEALGSPNIVTSDQNQKETWVYDKIATEASYVNKNSAVGAGGLGGGILSGPALLLGLGGASASRQSGNMSTTQKTLTVVIKFDQNKNVESFSYHSSKF